jgi:hypothetical protein
MPSALRLPAGKSNSVLTAIDLCHANCTGTG